MIPALNIDLPEDFRVDVKTTHNRGFTPEEIAQRCADKIVAVGDSAPLQFVIKRWLISAISQKSLSSTYAKPQKVIELQCIMQSMMQATQSLLNL